MSPAMSAAALHSQGSALQQLRAAGGWSWGSGSRAQAGMGLPGQAVRRSRDSARCCSLLQSCHELLLSLLHQPLMSSRLCLTQQHLHAQLWWLSHLDISLSDCWPLSGRSSTALSCCFHPRSPCEPDTEQEPKTTFGKWRECQSAVPRAFQEAVEEAVLTDPADSTVWGNAESLQLPLSRLSACRNPSSAASLPSLS